MSVGLNATDEDCDARHAWDLPHPDFAHLLAVEQPDLCVNAAGRASVPASLIEPVADFEASVLLTIRLLDDLRRSCPAATYVHLSSAAVYGNPAVLPIREDALVAPISPYGWHKHLSETVVLEYAQEFALRTVSLRIFSAYGRRLQRQVVRDLAERAIANPDGPLLLQGCPDDSRDFIHGDDIAEAVRVVAERGELVGKCYNLASGVETPVRELAELLLRLLGREPRIEFDSRRRPGNPARWHADIGKLAALGFVPRIRLQDGLREVIDEAIRVRGQH